MVHARRLILAAFSLLAAAGPAGADGKFFARPLVEEPSIALQRGLIAWRDGVETLIVQSVVEGGGEEMGWIVPLPAPPTAIESCHPKTLERLAELATPLVRTSARRELTLALMLFVMALAVLIQTVRRPKESRSDWRLRLLFYAAAGSFVLALTPTLASSSGRGAQVKVMQSVAAGAYDVDVIRGDSATAVEHWLTTNGFACPPAVRPTLDAYVAQHWCFAAAKVRRPGNGAIEHHPLRFTFPAERAVYPMRLTGVNQSSVTLDLFVIGKQQAATGSLTPWLVQTFKKSTPRIFDDYEVTAGRCFRAAVSWMPIGVSDVADLMWDGCVLTRLHGTLRGRVLADDLAVGWQPAKSFVNKLHSTTSAAQFATAAGAVVLAGGLLLVAIRVRRGGWNARTVSCRGLIPVALLGAAASAGCWLCIPAVKVAERSVGWFWNPAADIYERVLSDMANSGGVASFESEFAARIDKELNRDEAIGSEFADYVHGYSVDVNSSGWKLNILGEAYTPMTMSIDSTGRPVRRGAGSSRAGD